MQYILTAGSERDAPIRAMSSLTDIEGWLISYCDRELGWKDLCIQRTLIDFLSILFLAIYSLSLLTVCYRRGSSSNSRGNSKQWDFIIISLCCAVAGIAYFFAGGWTLFSKEFRFTKPELVHCFSMGLTWVVLGVSLNIHPTKWIENTNIVWWISSPLLATAYNIQVLLKDWHTDQVLDLLSWPIGFLLLYCACKLIIHRFPNWKQSKDGVSQPLLSEKSSGRIGLSNAGLLSVLTFSWLNPLMRLGYSKPLNLSDIPPLDPEDTAFRAYETFSAVWEIQQQEKENHSRILFLALVKSYMKEVLITGFYALLKTVSVSVSPLILYAFVQYSYLPESDLQLGFLLVGSLILMKLVESLSNRLWFFYSRRLGMRMRSALMAAVFQKQLKLSSTGRNRQSSGEIVNYIAVDAYRLGEFPCWFHMGWSLLVQLLFSVAILFWAVGYGALPGLVPLIICGALNVPFAKILQGYQSKFMVAQDERLRATSEALNNMKIIKLQSWEEKFRKMIEVLRDGEFHWLTEIQTKKAYGTALYWMSPTIVSAVIFTGTAATGSVPLNARTIFTVLATLRVMSDPVRLLPEVLSMLIQVKVSLDRIGVFLQEDEIKEADVRRNPLQDSDIIVRVQEGHFSWEPDESITLKNVNISVSKSQKVAVCGPVGSGKSSLLYAVLGQIPKISGSVEVFGSIAYVPQTSWIQSGTIRDNILFGKPMNQTFYEKAIKCCALDKDIANFDHGDLTEIGQRGLNMSGGQKQRIQLARAVYNDADIYILDDPFSAVDAHTAAILFHDCVMTALKTKTVVLVTHQIEFLNQADKILVMENGQVIEEGTYEELLKSGTAFEKLVDAHETSLNTLESLDHDNQLQADITSSGLPKYESFQFKKQSSEEEISIKAISSVQLTEDEEMAIGNLGLKPYKDYFSVSKGYSIVTMVIIHQTIFTVLQSLSTYWLAIAGQAHQVSSGLLVGVYSAISIISCLFSYFRSLSAAHLGLKASKVFFSSFMDSVFKAPMLFFDSTPIGRILTRVSSDLSILDFDIPYSIAFVIAGGTELITVILVMASVTWQVLVVAIPVMIIMVFVQRYYVASARELVRINGTTKAPVMNYASEALQGAITIRAFTVTERFIQTNLNLIDTDAKLFYYTAGTLEWVLLRVETLQNLTVFTSSLFLILLPQGTISPGFSGLCLSYALTLSMCQVFMTRYYSSLENYIISVERIKQFMHIPSEPPAVIDENRPPSKWPHEGRIDLQDLKVKYRPTAPLVLKGITCTFVAGSKVGVVGRTGSGKTTLISALFRLIDPYEGRILIDDLDICSIGLKDLRMKISVIPQEPTLFRGSIRSNLDPLGLYTDQEIWEAIEKCQLKLVISSLPALLDSSVSDEGQNWSAGQRQLFCLGRVLLRKNRILVLDEATASIDSATDLVLQRVIRKEFATCTVITIAHRVPTVIDSDMVMVLSYGKLVEYNKPSKLMENSSSAFSKLVAEYWSNCKRESIDL